MPQPAVRHQGAVKAPSGLEPKFQLFCMRALDFELAIRRGGDAQRAVPIGCRVFLVDTSFYHYKSKRCGQADLRKRIKEIAQTRVRYGYRRVHVLLRREGWAVNVKRVYRLYHEMGLQLRNKTPKRRVKAKLREARQVPQGANETWAMDFVHDQLAMGRKLRILTVVDAFITRSWSFRTTELPHHACFLCTGSPGKGASSVTVGHSNS
jgi:transposase InsO family protein